MKNILITASILFAFSGAFAQEKGSKNIKPVKAPSSSSRPMSSEVESFKKDNNGNVKPIKGNASSTTTSKTTPIRPQKSAAGSSTRAASGTKVNTNKAEKPVMNNSRAASGSKVNTNKAEKPVMNNSRAASGSKVNTNKAEKSNNSNTRAASGSKVNTNKAEKSNNSNTRAASGSKVNTNKAEKSNNSNTRAASGSKVNTNKAEKSTNNDTRAASGSKVNTNKAEKPVSNSTKNNTVVEKGEKGNSEAKGERPSSKFDADYCKGWKDGFTKAYKKGTKEKLESSDIPRCESNGKCEGYKCGYEAGMEKAELILR